MTEITHLETLVRVEFEQQTAEQAQQEAAILEDFVVTYADLYQFIHPESADGDIFLSLFAALLEQRLLNEKWRASVNKDHQLRTLQCIRLMTRDGHLRKQLVDSQGVQAVAHIFDGCARAHASGANSPFQVELLTECAAMVKRLAGDEWGIDALVECSVHATLVSLLGSSDPTILPLVLVALIGFASHREHCALVSRPPTLDLLLVMVQQYDPPFKRLAADVLAVLCRKSGVVAELLHLGLPGRVLCQLQSGDSTLVQSLLRMLCHLASNREAVQEVYQVGVVPMLMSLATLGDVEASDPLALPASRVCELQLVCAATARLAESHDDVGYQIRQCNGVCLVGRLLMLRPLEGGGEGDDKREAEVLSLRAHALRALRYLFSVERIRKVFKRLFPPDFFSSFIDMGHYNPALPAYAALLEEFDDMSDQQRASVSAALEDINMDSEAGLRTIHGYVVLELLGRGAFGAVYRARRERGEAMFALKELPLNDVGIFGATDAQRNAGVGRMSKEVEILSGMQHPNIVQYQECFVEGAQLYIVMELLEGPTLMDYLASLAQKARRMQEADVWQVLVALVLALQYMHGTKRVIHRDLTPSNIVLGQGPDGLRHTKITDFGLAKSLASGTNNQSMVGTMPYTCPEIIQQEQYSEKADVWSLGCVLYHMLMLRPPFEGSNPLSVASKIVEGSFDTISDPPTGPPYSDTIKQLVTLLLTTQPDRRPSIDMVGARIAPQLMAAMDRLGAQETMLSRALNAERQHRRNSWDISTRRTADTCRRLQVLQRDPTVSGSETGSAMSSQPSSPSGSTYNLSTMVEGYTGLTPVGSPTLGVPQTAQLHLATGLPPQPGSPGFATGTGRTVSIAQSRLRPVSDPCAQLLHQLHKVMWVEQLPPGLSRDPRRRCIESFSRRLFACGSNSGNLKVQMAKLMAGSPEVIVDPEGPLDFGPLPLGDASLGKGHMLTYEQLQGLLEALLDEKGYYAHTCREQL